MTRWLLASVAVNALLLPSVGFAQTGAPIPAPDARFRGTLGRDVKHSSPYAPLPKPPQAPANAPNILIVMTDDVGFAASSTFGGPIASPVLDRLAAEGLKYNRFHTASLCSPTRAALLTGRNPHSVGFGSVAELPTGYPGYDTVIPRNAATLGRVFRANGYATGWFGKNHNTPAWEVSPSGPFDHWPTGLGFDEFYGFMDGGTDQWAPALYHNTTAIEPPHDDPTYILDRDLVDKAIDWVRLQKAAAPSKPFLLYLPNASGHAPHDAPKDWIARYRGKFDQGWDRLREESFARQKTAGVIPPTADLSVRPTEIPAWSSLTSDQRRVAAREMEVYAAALAHFDYQFGRLVQTLKDMGQYDNTLIVFIQGDNGASGEGGLLGTANSVASANAAPNDEQRTLALIDEMGGPRTANHYAVGWAWAMNTPFQWTKQIASHLGGTRNGMVVSWPAQIKAHGALRSQFVDVTDVMPTLYEAAGIRAPKAVDGIVQAPIDGISFAYSFDAPTAPSKRRTQYFETFANRAIYHDGWMASTRPARMPWVRGANATMPEADAWSWELYNLDTDYSQAHDLAASDPARLNQLKRLFDAEAKKYNVFPIQTQGTTERLLGNPLPVPADERAKLTYYRSDARFDAGGWPDLLNRSWKMNVPIEIPAGQTATDGMLVTTGGYFGGWGLMVLDGRPTFTYRLTNDDAWTFSVKGQRLAPGPHTISVVLDYRGNGAGKNAVVGLVVDGTKQGEVQLPRTLSRLSRSDTSIGYDSGTPLTDSYRASFRFPGTIRQVDLDLGPSLLNRQK